VIFLEKIPSYLSAVIAPADLRPSKSIEFKLTIMTEANGISKLFYQQQLRVNCSYLIVDHNLLETVTNGAIATKIPIDQLTQMVITLQRHHDTVDPAASTLTIKAPVTEEVASVKKLNHSIFHLAEERRNGRIEYFHEYYNKRGINSNTRQVVLTQHGKLSHSDVRQFINFSRSSHLLHYQSVETATHRIILSSKYSSFLRQIPISSQKLLQFAFQGMKSMPKG
jgi:hypothetical protein